MNDCVDMEVVIRDGEFNLPPVNFSNWATNPHVELADGWLAFLYTDVYGKAQVAISGQSTLEEGALVVTCGVEDNYGIHFEEGTKIIMHRVDRELAMREQQDLRDGCFKSTIKIIERTDD